MRNRWVGVALWGAAVVLAVGAGTGAVAAAGAGSGRQVLSQDQVDRDLGTTPWTPPAAPHPVTTGGAPAQALFTSAGAVAVECSGNTATLLRWTPATGFRADDPRMGPAATVSVRFESTAGSRDDEDLTVTVHCVNGTATAVSGDDNGNGPGNGGPTPTATGTNNGGDNNGGDDNGGDHDGGKHDGGKDGHDQGDNDRGDR
jgi:hypothetical protein